MSDEPVVHPDPPSHRTRSSKPGLRATGLRVDALPEPFGIDSPRPEFSWHPMSLADGVVQAGWEVQVGSSRSFGDHLVWESGLVVGDRPYGARYTGQPLVSSTAYWWRVRLWDAAHATGGWSEPAVFETGILDPREWQAAWVTGPDGGTDDQSALALRGVVDLPSPIARARAYVSALGWYHFFVNGTDLTGPALVPRWTPIGMYVEYQTYDITASLRPGINTLGIAVGDGRYRGVNGFFNRRAVFGHRLAGFAQLVIDLVDGTRIVSTTDGAWTAGTGRILTSDPKYGERADLRRSDTDWLTGDNPPTRFHRVAVLAPHGRALIAQSVPAVADVTRLPARVWRSPSGSQLVDLGQNIAGILRIRLRGPAGRTVRMTFGEVLTPDGEFDPAWIIGHQKPWMQRDEVTLAGEDVWWQPWFTIHGFRYVLVEGLNHDLRSEDVEGIVLSSQLDSAGSFAASDERLTKLWQNVLWSARSNFTDTATDCPTRERSGWTGDIQVFAPAATGLLDSQAFLRRYLHNVAAEQREDGGVPPWIPSERTGVGNRTVKTVLTVTGNSVGWGDVTTLLPWTMWHYYGDRRTLETGYEPMRRWVDRLARKAQHPGPQRWFAHRTGKHERWILDRGFHWGEWLRPGEGFPTNLLDGSVHGAAVATAYFARSSRVLADVADLLGRSGDAAHYGHIAMEVRAAWRAAFLHDGGRRIGRDLQDDYVRALSFELLEPEERAQASDRLVELIDSADGHLGTGFLSTPLLLDALADNGHADTAFRLLFQDTSPSWLYQVERGATTPWETWDGYTADGYAHDSHNHYALGSVVQWMRERVAGISPLTPGYRHIRFAPLVTQKLRWVEASVMTPYGLASNRWEGTEAEGHMTVTVPTGAEAQIVAPDGSRAERGSGSWIVSWPATGSLSPSH